MTELVFWLTVLGWLFRAAVVVLPIIGLARIYRRATKYHSEIQAVSGPWEDDSASKPTPFEINMARIERSPGEGVADAKTDFFLIGGGLVAGLLGEVLFAVL